MLRSRKAKEIYYKTDEEVERIRESCLLVCKVLSYVGSKLRAGINGDELDREAEEMIRDHGALPGFKGLYGCPSTLLVSQNEEVVHGLPTKPRPFQDGDIVSIDCGVLMNGFYGDAAYTFPIGEIDEKVMRLLSVTKASLYRGIDAAQPGKRIGDISHAIQHFVEREHRYSVVRELVGHGLGRSLHEDPEVPNFGMRGRGVVLKEGLVIAIEPMVNMGRKEVRAAKDGWTIYARDRKPSAHFEHSVVIKKDGAECLSDHTPIEAAIEANPNLTSVKDLQAV